MMDALFGGLALAIALTPTLASLSGSAPATRRRITRLLDSDENRALHRRTFQGFLSAVRRRLGREQRQIPATSTEWADALDRIGRSIRAGETLRSTLVTVGPLSRLSAFVRLSSLIVNGAPLDQAISKSFGRSADWGSADELLVSATLHVAARHGGQVAASLDAAAATLRERAGAIEERQMFASQARLSSQVLSLLPIAVASWTLATDERARTVWFGGPIGLGLLTCGLGLNATGWWWMKSIVAQR